MKKKGGGMNLMHTLISFVRLDFRRQLFAFGCFAADIDLVIDYIPALVDFSVPT